ncbi:MAG: aminoacyl-tRNA hydrolase [Planctomycetota bacterium]|jgi:PTH1 family peptidyl-tRNA hydrolase
MARTQSSGDDSGAAAAAEPRLILICLGNPGRQYAGTRHNAGRLFAEHLRERHGFAGPEPIESVEAVASRGELAGMDAFLIEPTTSMNDCGRVVAPLMERFGGAGALCAIAHDDLDLALGSVRGRQKGGHGRHNGVRAILREGGEVDFFRVKIGVSSRHKQDYESVADFLLSPFEPEERERLEASFPQAAEILSGHVKSHLARLARKDRRQDVRARYVAEVLAEARAALEGLPAASPYPIFLNRRQAGRLFDVVTALAKLLRKGRRAAAEDDEFCERLLAFVPEELHSLLPPRRPSQRFFFAADLHLRGDAFKLIELNCAVGYAHWARLADEALYPLLRERLGDVERAVEAQFAGFLYEHGLRPLHEPERGLLAFLRGFNDSDMFNVEEVEGLAGRVAQQAGLEVPLCHQKDLELREDGLHLSDGRRVDLLYVEENLADWAHVADEAPLRRAVRDGLVKTFPPLDMFLYTNKGFLSLLADPSARAWLDPDERESQVIRANVLWSHPLDAHIEPAAYYMLEQGLSVVVKEMLGGGGRGVTVLRPDSSSQQAGHLLRQRLAAGNSIVQGYFPPGRWSPEVDFNFDVRVLCAGHEGDISIGPVYGRIWRGEKVNFTDPDSGVAPVYFVG